MAHQIVTFSGIAFNQLSKAPMDEVLGGDITKAEMIFIAVPSRGRCLPSLSSSVQLQLFEISNLCVCVCMCVVPVAVGTLL